MVTSRSAESRYLVSPAKVLGCLRTGKLTVILFQGVGFVNGGLVTEISIDLVPLELRMPNSQFDLQRQRSLGSNRLLQLQG